MRLAYTRNFIKQAKKLSPKHKNQLQDRLAEFVENPFADHLRNHQLKGEYKQYRSINISGDLRALYVTRNSEVIFDILGTHSQLYG